MGLSRIRLINGSISWLCLKRLLNPKHDILAIKYFTARVTGKLDPSQPVRQKTYIRAMEKHIPELSVHYGQFNSHTINAPLAYPIDSKTFGKHIKFANIIKTEEKGSDVNLAVHVLNDAWRDVYDCAVIVSIHCIENLKNKIQLLSLYARGTPRVYLKNHKK